MTHSTNLPFQLIEDNGFVINLDRVPPRVKKVAAFLDTLEFGKVMKTQTLADRVGICLEGFSCHPYLRNYRIPIKHALYWGSKETIAKAKEQ